MLKTNCKIFGTLTSKSAVAEQLKALKPLVARDNVHLTAPGYKALAEGIFREALNFGVTRKKVNTLSQACRWSG